MNLENPALLNPVKGSGAGTQSQYGFNPQNVQSDLSMHDSPLAKRRMVADMFEDSMSHVVNIQYFTTQEDLEKFIR